MLDNVQVLYMFHLLFNHPYHVTTNVFFVLHIRILYFTEDRVTCISWILLESDKNKI